MSNLKYAALGVAVLLIACEVRAQDVTQVDQSKTTYGEKNSSAPKELDVFSFLIGKWRGTGKTRLPDGKVVEFGGVSWIGRYILDGTAIADEGHAAYPDGRPALGVTFRQYDAARKTWIVEHLNVSESFLRKQVNGGSGSVEVDGRVVRVVTEGSTRSREHYIVVDQDNWVYRMDLSTDGGRSWNEGQVEMTFRRSE
ncbi:MAG TPA: hypothetical protein VFO82_07195 [Steroidobacteraceae bacterium]|nr:hypothetical protein [Vicinamibacterales bacterium]HET9473662.1 hypothetical protein [Steroidobacteraceae bacterium]